MLFEGNVTEVVRAMREKQQLIAAREPDTGPRLLLVGGGGVMYGCEAGGTVTALNEAGYTQVFDWVVGLSTSAPGAAYFLCGNARVGTTIYSEECCTEAFISLKRRYPVDVSYLDQVFQGLTGKRLIPERVFANRSRLLIGITSAKTGQQRLVEPKTAKELFAAIHASMSIPGLTKGSVEYEGRHYVDGAHSRPLPLKYLVRRYQPTHIVVIPNRTMKLRSKPSKAETLLYETVLRKRVSPVVRAISRDRRSQLTESLRWLREESDIPYLIAWSGGEIGRFERDPDKIRTAAATAEQRWRELLG